MVAKDLTETKKPMRPPLVDSPYLWASEAALYLRISLRALENFRASGEGPAYRKHGGRIVYHREDLERWSLRRRFQSSAKRNDEV